MGLATIDPPSQKENIEIHKIPKFGVNRAFKNVKNLQRNVWKTGQFRTNVRICPDLSFIVKWHLTMKER